MVRSKSVMLHDDYVEKMADRKLGPEGTFLFPDATPIAPPLGYIKQPSITERIRDMVRSEHLRRAAEAAGAESFEEANDFDVGDDFDPQSPYEDEFDPLNPDADLVPPVASTGVPSPGGGEGAGGTFGAPPAAAARAVAPGGPAPVAPPAGPPKTS